MVEMNVPLSSNEPALNVPSGMLAVIGERFYSCPRPWIVLGIGALHSVREWPDEYWVEFLAKLRPHSAGTFFFIGGDNYTQRAQSLIAQSGLKEAVNACNLSLIEAVALLHHADLFIGTDSGPMNLAAAAETDAFTLFGGTPVQNYSKFIHPIVPDGGPVRGGMARISPAVVLAQVTPFLSRPKDRR